MRAFGFDDISDDFEQFEHNADDIMPEVEQMAIKMRDRARSIATAKGLRNTGQGVEGIEVEERSEKPEGYDVGWGQRPGFHLFFHEIGFHALDNRRGKVRLRRNSRGSRARIYDSKRATYVPAKPHMRPAFDELEPQFYEKIQKTIEKGV